MAASRIEETLMGDRNLRIIAACGLAVGAILGLAGAFAPAPTRGLLWALDGTGLVIACALLALHHFRLGHDLVAGGFIVFAIGEGVMLSCAALDPGDPVPISSFAAGAGLWAAGLALISAPPVMPLLVRILGFISALLFAIHAVMVFSGHPLSALSTPLPVFAYPFLVITLLCWAFLHLREPR
jgi:hypothetical protein